MKHRKDPTQESVLDILGAQVVMVTVIALLAVGLGLLLEGVEWILVNYRMGSVFIVALVGVGILWLLYRGIGTWMKAMKN